MELSTDIAWSDRQAYRPASSASQAVDAGGGEAAGARADRLGNCRRKSVDAVVQQRMTTRM